eukprot:10641984-Alexandrium_andersonii.AAC.1
MCVVWKWESSARGGSCRRPPLGRSLAIVLGVLAILLSGLREWYGRNVFFNYKAARASLIICMSLIIYPPKHLLNYEGIATAARRQPTPRCLTGHGCTWRTAVLVVVAG